MLLKFIQIWIKHFFLETVKCCNFRLQNSQALVLQYIALEITLSYQLEFI